MPTETKEPIIKEAVLPKGQGVAPSINDEAAKEAEEAAREAELEEKRRNMTLPLSDFVALLFQLAQAWQNSQTAQGFFSKRVEEDELCQKEEVDERAFITGGGPTNGEFYREMLTLLDHPKTFAEASRHFPKIFPSYVSGILLIGESTGNIDVIYRDLANYLTDQEKNRKMLMRLLSYPAIVSLFATVLVIMIVRNLVPLLRDFYAALAPAGAFPAFSTYVLNILYFIGNYWYAIVGGVFITSATYARLHLNSESFRRLEQKLFLNFPIKRLAPLMRDPLVLVDTANWFYCVNLLWTSGAVPSKILEQTAEVFFLYELRDACIAAREDLLAGVHPSMADALATHSPYFHRMSGAYKALKHREMTGDQLYLKHFSQTLRELAQHKIEMLLKWVEPVVIAIICLIVGAIVIAMYLPLINLIGIMAQPH